MLMGTVTLQNSVGQHWSISQSAAHLHEHAETLYYITVFIFPPLLLQKNYLIIYCKYNWVKVSLGTVTDTVAYEECQLISEKQQIVSILVPSTRQTNIYTVKFNCCVSSAAVYTVRQKDWKWGIWGNTIMTIREVEMRLLSSVAATDFACPPCDEMIKNITV